MCVREGQSVRVCVRVCVISGVPPAVNNAGVMVLRLIVRYYSRVHEHNIRGG